jgi:hypothetical protein
MAKFMVSYNLENYSGNSITCKVRNYQLNQFPETEVTTPTVITFGIVADFMKLDFQASVFADKVETLDSQKLRNIFGNKTDIWRDSIRAVYFYSYIKCLLYGISNTPHYNIPDSSSAFIGHAVLLNTLQKRNFMCEYQYGHSVNYRVEVIPEEVKQLIDVYKKNFNFVEDNLILNSSGTVEFNIPKFERYIDGLGTSFSDSLTVVQCTGDTHKAYLVDDKIAFVNSAYSSIKEDESSFYTYKDFSDFLDISVIFGKACFFCLKSGYSKDNIQFYEKLKCVDKDRRLSKFEVRSVTGLKCDTNPMYEYKGISLNRLVTSP